MTNAEFAKTLAMPPEYQAKAAAFADAKGLSLAARDVIAEYKDAWTGRDGKVREPQLIMIVSADAAMSMALSAGRNFAPVSTEWTSDGKEWVDVWIDAMPPKACRVTFEVEGIESPVRVTHTLMEYAQGELSATQRKMPALMLAKATMQLGLRRIAPQALAGLYSQEEAQAVAASIDAEVEHVDRVVEAVTPKPETDTGGKMTRAQQYAARKDELVTTGRAMRAELGDEAAERFAVVVNNMRKNAGLDLDKITAKQIGQLLAAARVIRADIEGKAAAMKAVPEPAPAPAPAPAEPADDPDMSAGAQALAENFDAEFVI